MRRPDVPALYEACRDKFVADPKRYVKPAAEPVGLAPASPRSTWTCPMHPQMVRDEPGRCPICAMALEPMTVAADEGDKTS